LQQGFIAGHHGGARRGEFHSLLQPCSFEPIQEAIGGRKWDYQHGKTKKYLIIETGESGGSQMRGENRRRQIEN